MAGKQSAEQDKKNKGESSVDNNNDQGDFKRPLEKQPLAGEMSSFSVSQQK